MKKKLLTKTMGFALAVGLVVSPVYELTTLAASGSSPAAETSRGGDSSSSSSDSDSTTAEVISTNTVVVGGRVIQSSVSGSYTATVVNGTAIMTPVETFKQLSGISRNEGAYVIMRNSRCGASAKACLSAVAGALGVAEGPTIDFYVTKSMLGAYDAVSGFSGDVTVCVGIPAQMRNAALDYALIRVSAGGEVKVLPDADGDAETITVGTEKPGVFMLVSAPKGFFEALR